MSQERKTHSTVHESREIYKARQFSLVTEKITLPNGIDSETAFVRHPGSTVIVPVFDDGRIGLIKQYRHPVNDYLYEIPAGTMNPGEIPESCAKRELEEEIGYAAGQITALGWTFLLPAYSDECAYVYLAENLIKTAQKLDHDEIIELFRFSMQEIREMVERNSIVDALSILAIYRAMGYLKRKGNSCDI
jgi:ADP-ribose pyrophosphatase